MCVCLHVRSYACRNMHMHKSLLWCKRIDLNQYQGCKLSMNKECTKWNWKYCQFPFHVFGLWTFRKGRIQEGYFFLPFQVYEVPQWWTSLRYFERNDYCFTLKPFSVFLSPKMWTYFWLLKCCLWATNFSHKSKNYSFYV